MTDGDAHQVVLDALQGALEHPAEERQSHRQVRRRDTDDAKDAHLDVPVPPTPDVHQHGGQRTRQKRHREPRTDSQQRRASDKEQPGKLCPARTAIRVFFEHLTIVHHKEDVEDELDTEPAKVEERGDQAPVLVQPEHEVRRKEELVVRYQVQLVHHGKHEGRGDPGARNGW